MTATQRTSSYRFTIQSLDDPRLAELRKEVAARNKFVPWSEPQQVSWRDFPVITRMTEEVKVQARLGKENPKREKYRLKSGILHTQVVRLEDGAYFDVYVHQRYREKDAPGTAELLSAVPVAPPDPVDVLKSRSAIRLDVLLEDLEAELATLPHYRAEQVRTFVAKRLAFATARILG